MNTEEQFLYESNLIENETSDEAFEDAKMAWNYAVANKRKINVQMILQIHRLLMKRLDPRIAGHLRMCDVWIGGNKKGFLTTGILEEQLELVCQEINAKKENPSESWCKEVHVMFEDIHPFEDGNGRVGRILYNFHRLKLGLGIDVIWDDEKQDYYKWFKK